METFNLNVYPTYSQLLHLISEMTMELQLQMNDEGEQKKLQAHVSTREKQP